MLWHTIARCAALALLLLVAAGQAAGQQAPLPRLEGRVAMLADPRQELGLEEVLALTDRFVPVRADANFGYTRDGIWLRLALPAAAPGRGVLVLQPNFLDRIDFYIATEREGLRAADFTRVQAGDHRPFAGDGVSGIVDAVRLDFAPGETVLVYINIRNTNSSTHIDLTLVPEADHATRMTVIGLIYGLWFGGMAVLVVIQLVFFYFDRKPQYPWLMASTVGVMLIYVGNLGLSRVFLFPQNGAANDFFLGFNAWGGLTVAVLSCMSILGLSQKPRPLRAIYQAGAVAGIVGCVFAALGQNLAFGPFGASISVLLALGNMLVALYYRHEDGTAGAMRAAAYTVTGIGAALAMLQRMGLPFLPNFVTYAYGLAVLLQILLLTGAMAVRLRDAERRNRALQRSELENAQTAEKIAARLVRHRTRELVEARQIAEEALRVELEAQQHQVRFLEAVSHQYRTPLAVIRANVDAMGLSLPPQDRENHVRVTRIRRSVSRLVDILELNLARSQVQGASFRAALAPVGAERLVLSAVERARELMPGVGIEVAVDPAAGPLPVNADVEMIELALVSLIENAVKYSAAAGQPPVRLALRAEGPGILIEVADRGIGIPDEAQAEVFKKGYRAANVSSVDGSGLGLFLVERIVKAHGGTVAIESALGQGTVVQIRLAAMAEGRKPAEAG